MRAMVTSPLLSLRRSCPQVLELAQQLAPMAAQLLGTPKLRLYQDCLFLKNAGGGGVFWLTSALPTASKAPDKAS